jgi:hypothetical protein
MMKTQHSGSRLLVLRNLLLLAALTAASLPALGNPRDVEADPAKDYTVTPEAGQWLICTGASFTGPQAQQMAHELALEIRRRYKVPAFVFKSGEKERREQQEHLERMHQLCPNVPVRIVRIEEQCAILVGGYKDMDSARRALNEIRKMKLPTDLSTSVGAERDPQGSRKEGAKPAGENPFVISFVVHNPTIPLEKETDKPDPFLKELNDGRPYNLFKCRQPWTLAVAQYQGATVVQARNTSSGGFLKALGLDSEAGKLLNASALQAESVAEVLNKISAQKQLGFEAYVLHTRNASVVTVGGFSGLDDPNLRKTQQLLATLSFREGSPIKLFVTPLPMQVPRP